MAKAFKRYKQNIYWLRFLDHPVHLLDFIVSKERKLCVWDTVNKRGADRRHNYVYINSPDGDLGVISFRRL